MAKAATEHKVEIPAITDPKGLAAELRRLAASNLPLPAGVAEALILTFKLDDANGKADDAGKKADS